MPRARTGTIVPIDGKIYAKVNYTDENGKRRQKYRRAKNRSDAHAKKRQLLNELDAGGERVFDGERMTFALAAEIYSAERLKDAEYRDGRKVAGLRNARTARAHLAASVEHFGKRRIRSITHGDIAKFKAARLATPIHRGTPRAVATVNRELEVLRALMHHAHREGWILQNPFQRGAALISKAEEARRERILTPDEEALLLSACTGRRAHLRPILVAVLDVAARPGEVFNLTWADVDLAGGTLILTSHKGKVMTRRTVGMTPRLKEEIERLWWKSGQDVRARVFGVTTSVKKSWAAACKAAGVEGARLYDVRHSSITRMMQAGISHSLAMKVTGHTQMATFLRYTNPDADIARQIASQLAEYDKDRQPADGEK